MDKLCSLLVALIAVLHLWFLVLEMFFWTKPLGLKVFKQSKNAAMQSATLAANQGLYNGFLSAGLFWSLLISDPLFSVELQMFFLTCVVIAGTFGALTVSKRIFWVQASPAVAAIGLILLLHR